MPVHEADLDQPAPSLLQPLDHELRGQVAYLFDGWRAAATLKRTAIYQHFPGYLGFGKDSWRASIGAKMPEKNTPAAPAEAPKKKGKGKGKKKAQE